MVSAVFHSPLETPTSPAASPTASSIAKAVTASASAAPAPAAQQPTRDFSAIWMAVLPPVLGLAFLVLIWQLIASSNRDIPMPSETWAQALKVFADPFYSNGPNDQGVGWNVLASLQRVAIGFGLAALVGIPAGFAIGRFEFLSRMFNPLISLLRPVSPLAWLPIGLLVFKGADPAAIWTIFICSIWPMVINTAVGVQRVPSDYMNVARVLNLSEWKIFTKILFPAVLPYLLTGVRHRQPASRHGKRCDLGLEPASPAVSPASMVTDGSPTNARSPAPESVPPAPFPGRPRRVRV